VIKTLPSWYLLQSGPKADQSDISQIFKVDDIFTLWMDILKFIMTGFL